MKNELYEWDGSNFKEEVITAIRYEECEAYMKRLDELSRTPFKMPNVSISVFNSREIYAQNRARK
jgi:hypothetical protein